MPKPLILTLLALGVAGVAIVVYGQYQGLTTKSLEVQQMEQGIREIDEARCELERVQKKPVSDICKKLQQQ